MKLLHTSKATGQTRDITGLMTQVTWSGDQASIPRKLEGTIAFREGGGLPEPAPGDLLSLSEGTERLIDALVVRRQAGSEEHTMDLSGLDYGFYLKRNDYTGKHRTQSPEAITRAVCAARGIPVAALPVTGVTLSRKFSGTPLTNVIQTLWSLAAEQTGERYAIRYTPAGLLVKVKTVARESLIIRGKSNLMDATTTESIENMVNRVAVYDKNGSLLRTLGTEDDQALYGVMEQHVTQAEGEDAAGEARRLLEDGALAQTVTINMLGDLRCVTGETVAVEETATGLTGIFWIDGDVHTWKLGQYYTRLTLNCRNVMASASAGSELE